MPILGITHSVFFTRSSVVASKMGEREFTSRACQVSYEGHQCYNNSCSFGRSVPHGIFSPWFHVSSVSHSYFSTFLSLLFRVIHANSSPKVIFSLSIDYLLQKQNSKALIRIAPGT